MESMPIERWATGHLLVETGNRRETIEVGYGVSGGLAIWQGDIILGSAEDLAKSSAERPHGYRLLPENGVSIVEGDVIVGAGFKWLNNTIPYTIDSALPDQARVTDAIAHWQTKTPVHFTPRTSEANYVHFTPGEGCSSQVGMVGGRQLIVLQAECLKGQVIHEIGHAFGLWHEQSRADRDNFVTVYLNNVEDPNMRHNFDRLSSTVGAASGAYDYDSIMHYGATDFARPGTQTIVPKKAGVVIGQRVGLSAGDIASIYERCNEPVALRCAFDDTAMQLGDQGARSTVVQWSYDAGARSQHWTLKRSGQGSFLLINQSNGQALVYQPGTGALTTATPDVSQSWQRWQMESRPNGRMRIVNPATRNYLAIKGDWGKPDGRPIQVRSLPSGSGSLEYEWYYAT